MRRAAAYAALPRWAPASNDLAQALAHLKSTNETQLAHFANRCLQLGGRAHASGQEQMAELRRARSVADVP